MKVKVMSISNSWLPVKVGQETGFNMRVVTQPIDNFQINGRTLTENTTIALNVNSNLPTHDAWVNALQEGNVLDVDLVQMGQQFYVNKKHAPVIIKRVENGKKAKPCPR